VDPSSRSTGRWTAIAVPSDGWLCLAQEPHGVNPMIVADNHDTSIVMIRKNYSEFITDHSDAISRRTLSVFAGNVVSLSWVKRCNI
jgi:hypothetical protein